MAQTMPVYDVRTEPGMSRDCYVSSLFYLPAQYRKWTMNLLKREADLSSRASEIEALRQCQEQDSGG